MWLGWSNAPSLARNLGADLSTIATWPTNSPPRQRFSNRAASLTKSWPQQRPSNRTASPTNSPPRQHSSNRAIFPVSRPRRPFEQSLADQLAAASTLLERSNLADLTAETATFEQGLADQLAAASTLLEQSDLPRLTAETTAFEQSLADQLAAASALLEQSDFAGLTAETTAFEQSLADQLAAASALLERNEFARLMAETTALDRRELFDRLGDIEESLAAEQERNRDDFVGYVDDESFEVRDSLPGAQNPPRDGKSLAARRIETMWRVLGVFVTIDTIFLGGAATPALREAAIKGLAIIAHKVLLSLLLAGAQSPSLSSTPSVLGPETLSNPTHVSAEAFSEGHAVDEALMPVRDKDR